MTQMTALASRPMMAASRCLTLVLATSCAKPLPLTVEVEPVPPTRESVPTIQLKARALNAGHEAVTWEWEQVVESPSFSPRPKLNNANSSLASFLTPSVPEPWVLAFEARARTRSRAASAIVRVQILPNDDDWLVARAGPPGEPQRVRMGEEVILDGSASRGADGGPLTYRWTQYLEMDRNVVKVPLEDATSAKARFLVPDLPRSERWPGCFEGQTVAFFLRVTNARGRTASDSVQLRLDGPRATAEKIFEAQEAGLVTREQALLYSVYAVTGSPKLPKDFEAECVGYDGTSTITAAKAGLPPELQREVDGAIRMMLGR